MIKFNLKPIIHEYNRNHPKDKLTITKLSRKSGISRHSLSKLCGKYKQSKGINFDTLNRLINFFKLPVSKFISYAPDKLRITLFNMSDKLDKDKIKRHETMIIRNKAILLKIQSNNSDHANLAMAFPLLFNMSHHSIFLVKLYQLKPLKSNLTDFITSTDKRTKSYVYARIIAHSGNMKRSMISHADNMLIVPVVNDKKLLDVIYGLNRDDLITPKPIFKSLNDRCTIINKSSNRFK